MESPCAITLNPIEANRLAESIHEIEGVHHYELSRRDSLDGEHPDGFLIVRTVWDDGEATEDAIGETGSITVWSERR